MRRCGGNNGRVCGCAQEAADDGKKPTWPHHSVQDPHNFSDDREAEGQAEATLLASTFIPLRNAERCDKHSVLLEAQRSQDRRLGRTTVLLTFSRRARRNSGRY